MSYFIFLLFLAIALPCLLVATLLIICAFFLWFPCFMSFTFPSYWVAGFFTYRNSLYIIDINSLLATLLQGSSPSLPTLWWQLFSITLFFKGWLHSLWRQGHIFERTEVSWTYREVTNATGQNVCKQEFFFIVLDSYRS